MMIFSVSCASRNGNGLGFRSRYLAGLVVGALRRRFHETQGLPEPGLWAAPPTWAASGPSERFALQALGLNPRAQIPLAPVFQGSGGRGEVLIAIRGDAMTALGGDLDRIERAIVASMTPSAEAMGLGQVVAEAMTPEHMASNDRSHYFAQATTVHAQKGETPEQALSRSILHAAANTAFGYSDRTDRLLDISGVGADLRIEGVDYINRIDRPMSAAYGDETYAMSGIRFSMSGRLYAPLFLMDRPGRERPCVAQLDRAAMAALPEAA